MKFDYLIELVVILSNRYWCRYWQMYDYPVCTEFAIQLRDVKGKPVYNYNLECQPGFLRIDPERIYVFEKSNGGK